MNPTIENIILANSNYTELRNFMRNKDYMDYLSKETNFLQAATTKQRLWHLVNNIKNPMLCKCKKELSWNIKNNSYRNFCSSKCAHGDKSVKEKTEKTCKEKYGVKTYLLTQEAKDNYANKMIEEFGVDNPFKSQEVQQEIRDNIFEEYGVTSMSKLDWVKEKINQTHIEKYGRLRECQSHFSEESYNIKYDKRKLTELYDGGLSIKEIAEKLDVGHSQLCLQFKMFGIEIHQTVGQKQMFDFISQKYDGKIILNDKKILDGKEIDIFLPELMIGFEYDGLFWHCESSSGKINYHAEKDKIANEKGIKLYHILDYEWQNKQDLVKSRISSFLGKNKVIYARKTKIKILNKKVAAAFFEKNHIQGNAGASLYVGLILEENLVSAMSFGKSRYNDYQYELIRFCNLKDHNVVGGASKLFKFSVDHLKANNVVSFSDLRWGKGKLYETLGFSLLRNNKPSYSYTHNYRSFESRIKYQKHKLEKILPIYDKTLSEWENMKNNGFDRYWGSGNAVYLWTKEEACIECLD